MTQFTLAGKNTLVSGAASGIGAAIAKTFAEAGAFVFVADRDTAAGEATTAAIRASGGKAEFLHLDVALEDSAVAAAHHVNIACECLDVLVNNAGIGHVGALAHTTAQDLERLFRVNVLGVFNLCKAFAPAMIERRRGNIINLASIGGIVGIRDRLAYCTTKFAVVGLTKSMALDHARDGLRVNCICPGRVETPFVAARLKEYADPVKARQEMADSQAMGRMGTPEEIASAALYLASDASAFMTGTAFIIDGGFSAGK